MKDEVKAAAKQVGLTKCDCEEACKQLEAQDVKEGVGGLGDGTWLKKLLKFLALIGPLLED